jgi:NADH-quinone oxidoreductase subunit J
MEPALLAQAAEAATSSSATAETIVFWVFAVIGLGAAIAVITMRNIVHAALMLVVNLLAIAALYLALQSSFLGIVQVIVYAGAIVVLFLFVIMLLGVDRDDLLVETKRWHLVGAIAMTVLLAGGLLFAFGGSYLSADSACGGLAPTEATTSGAVRCVGLDQALADNDNGSVGVIADRMFTRWTFPFEAASLLLVVATIGALVLGRRKDEDLPADEAYDTSAAVPGDDDVAAVLAAGGDGDGERPPPGPDDGTDDDAPGTEAR